MAIGALDTVARRASVWHPRDTRRHGALPLAAPAGRIHREDRVVLGIGQPGEVPVHVASAGLAIGRDDGWPALCRYLTGLEGLHPSLVAELGRPGVSQVSHPLRLAVRRHEVPDSINLDRDDRHRAGSTGSPARHRKRGDTAGLEPRHEGVDHPPGEYRRPQVRHDGLPCDESVRDGSAGALARVARGGAGTITLSSGGVAVLDDPEDRIVTRRPAGSPPVPGPRSTQSSSGPHWRPSGTPRAVPPAAGAPG